MILDLSDVYEGRDLSTLTVDVADFHPNAEGHRVIARRLHTAIVGTPAIFAPTKGVAP